MIGRLVQVGTLPYVNMFAESIFESEPEQGVAYTNKDLMADRDSLYPLTNPLKPGDKPGDDYLGKR